MSRKAVSIADVAARAGVSPATVSHALSGRRRVSPGLAAAVRKAVKELGYTPNHYAAGLRTGSTRTLGLLVADIAHEFHAQLARGAEDAAEQAGYSLIICSSGFRREREAKYLRLLTSGAIDGLLYGAGAPPDRRYLRAASQQLPLVIVDEELPDLAASYVTSDNRLGGRLVGDHLRDLGHRQILYLGGPAALTTTQHRLAGLRSAFQGLDAEIQVRFGDYSQQNGAESVAQALREGGRFSAIFAGNDLIAVGVVAALQGLRLRVPDDISVVGFDDIRLSAYFAPPLTTVRQPVYQMGYTAAEQLLGALSTKVQLPAQRIALPVLLIPRGSTGAVAEPKPGSTETRRLMA